MKTITFDEKQWKLVPTDITQSMRDAGNNTLNMLAKEPGMGIADRAFYAYNAMLNAAPQYPADDGPLTDEKVGAVKKAAAPTQVETMLRQVITDPENQPNQYGVVFGMRGPKMTFSIGVQTFILDYEPDEPGDFEFMSDMLIHAFSTFTHDVKTQVETQAFKLTSPECWCEDCDIAANKGMRSRMSLCPDCGNKRCPKATNHANACTGSNAIGQPGSSWEHVKPATPPMEPGQQK